MVSLPQDPPSGPPFDSLSDRELVQRVQAGEIDAFGELFQRYNSQLCTYLARLTGSDDLGRDFAQDAFFKALLALTPKKDKNSPCDSDMLEAKGHRTMYYSSILDQKEIVYFKAWLYAIAINIAKDYWKRRKIWDKVLEKIKIIITVASSPEERVEETELVRQALAQVSVKYRPCLLLDIVEELPQHEIAQTLGISERTVRRYLRRGHSELCQAYDSLAEQKCHPPTR